MLLLNRCLTLLGYRRASIQYTARLAFCEAVQSCCSSNDHYSNMLATVFKQVHDTCSANKATARRGLLTPFTLELAAATMKLLARQEPLPPSWTHILVVLLTFSPQNTTAVRSLDAFHDYLVVEKHTITALPTGRIL